MSINFVHYSLKIFRYGYKKAIALKQCHFVLGISLINAGCLCIVEVAGEEPPTEETPAEETPAEETPSEETPSEETLAEETPAEETPAEETPSEETPAEETPHRGNTC